MAAPGGGVDCTLNWQEYLHSVEIAQIDRKMEVETGGARVEGSRVVVEEMPPYFFTGLLVRNDV